MPPTLYLIDGHALAYRTYYALTGAGDSSRWLTSKGEPTAGVFGFASVLLRYLEQDRPDYLAVAFDVGKTFRDDIFPDYKATREKMPDDLRVQIGRIQQMVDIFNIPRLEMEGYEADDVLGSVARKAAAQGLGVKIITGDRDLLQLVDSRIVVSLPEGKTLADSKEYTPPEVVERMGVRPDQVVDLKALQGDKSDNIPGVAGVGEKTATKLLTEYGTLDGIYAHLDEIKGSLQQKLRDQREQAYLSQRLARIITDLDIPLDLDQARLDNFDPGAVEELFRELEFRTLLKRLQELAKYFGKVIPPPPPPATRQMSMFDPPPGEPPAAAQLPISPLRVEAPIAVEVVQTPAALEALVSTLNAAEWIAFDTETTATDPLQARLVGISLAVAPGKGYYIPVGHAAPPGSQLALDTVIEALRPPLTNPKIQKVGHNAKYDYLMLAQQGLQIAPISFDTMIAEWLRDPASRNLGLKKLAWVNLGASMTEIEELLGKGKNQRTMDQVPVEQAAAYAAHDAEVTLRLVPGLQTALEQTQANRVFAEIEMPLVEVLAGMEMAGITLDVPFLHEMAFELRQQLAALETRVHEAVGQPFNLNSPQQLSDALFKRLRLDPPDRTRKTASGHYSTAADVLDALRGQHPVVEWILEHREYAKLLSTYVEALPTQVNPRTGRVHTSYNQTGSVTGRIASSEPNLQNIPIRTELGRRVRRAFVAAPGHALLAVDYSQVELRIVAHMSNDQAMLAAFQAGQDIHAATAAAVLSIPLEQVTSAQRRHAKAINFGLIYGMSAFGLTRTTDLTLAESENFVEAYFQQFPGVKRYLDGIRRKAAQQGYVETLLGRRRYFPGLATQGNQAIRSREEREAINAPIQGTAADIMKLAMIHMPQALAKAGLGARMLLQVHDELIFECPLAELAETARLVKTVMAGAYTLQVPLITEARSGPNWYQMAVIP